MKKEWIIWAVIGLLMGCGCNSSSDSHTEYMAFENVNYIKEFPYSYSLENDQMVDWDVIGVKSFSFFDSLLVVTSNADKDGLWHFLTAKDYRFLGNYLTQGGGPEEFKELPKVSDAKFYKKDNQVFADIYDFSGGKYFSINVSRTLENDRLDIQTVKNMLPAGLFDQVYIDSSTVYCRINALMQIKLNRFITSFDFDFNNGYIYAFDSREDTMYKYEANEILDQLHTML